MLRYTILGQWVATLHYIHESNLRLFEFMVIYSEYALLIAS